MTDLASHLLTVLEVAARWRLSERTIRDRIKSGELLAVRRSRDYLIAAGDMWACEHGRFPRGREQARQLQPLLDKQGLAGKTRTSARTVERWVAEGLPTRNVGVNVRFDEEQARIWLRGRFGFELPNTDHVLSETDGSADKRARA